MRLEPLSSSLMPIDFADCADCGGCRWLWWLQLKLKLNIVCCYVQSHVTFSLAQQLIFSKSILMWPHLSITVPPTSMWGQTSLRRVFRVLGTFLCSFFFCTKFTLPVRLYVYGSNNEVWLPPPPPTEVPERMGYVFCYYLLVFTILTMLHRLIKANKGLRKPTKANKGPQRLTQANKGAREGDEGGGLRYIISWAPQYVFSSTLITFF